MEGVSKVQCLYCKKQFVWRPSDHKKPVYLYRDINTHKRLIPATCPECGKMMLIGSKKTRVYRFEDEDVELLDFYNTN